MVLKQVPIVGAQYKECQFPADEILLIEEVLIAGQHDFKAVLFCRSQQISIGEFGPIHLFCCPDEMIVQTKAELLRYVVIKRIFTTLDDVYALPRSQGFAE